MYGIIKNNMFDIKKSKIILILFITFSFVGVYLFLKKETNIEKFEMDNLSKWTMAKCVEKSYFDQEIKKDASVSAAIYFEKSNVDLFYFEKINLFVEEYVKDESFNNSIPNLEGKYLLSRCFEILKTDEYINILKTKMPNDYER